MLSWLLQTQRLELQMVIVSGGHFAPCLAFYYIQSCSIKTWVHLCGPANEA